MGCLDPPAQSFAHARGHFRVRWANNACALSHVTHKKYRAHTGFLNEQHCVSRSSDARSYEWAPIHWEFSIKLDLRASQQETKIAVSLIREKITFSTYCNCCFSQLGFFKRDLKCSISFQTIFTRPHLYYFNANTFFFAYLFNTNIHARPISAGFHMVKTRSPLFHVKETKSSRHSTTLFCPFRGHRVHKNVRSLIWITQVYIQINKRTSHTENFSPFSLCTHYFCTVLSLL